MYEIKRILFNNKDNLHKVLLMENVKALTQQKFDTEFKQWMKDLKKLGYQSEFKILNSADYGSSQNRERVFMVSAKDLSKFTWPKPFKHNNHLKNIFDLKKMRFDDKWDFLFDKKWDLFKETNRGITKTKIYNYTNFNSENYLYIANKLGPTLTASGANSRLKFYWPKQNKIRLMNAIEAYKYMGFDENIADKVLKTKIISENKMIFTCGNSISVEVLEAIFRQVIKCLL